MGRTGEAEGFEYYNIVRRWKRNVVAEGHPPNVSRAAYRFFGGDLHESRSQWVAGCCRLYRLC